MEYIKIHSPAMLEETLSFLVPPKGEAVLLDCTLGEGGHSEAFLSLYPDLICIGIDADTEIQNRARQRLATFQGRVAYVKGFFDAVLANWDNIFLDFQSHLSQKAQNLRPHLILFDLGISQYHYFQSGRGFSFSKSELLDLRLCPEQSTTAIDIIHTSSEESLANLLFNFGQEVHSRKIARAVLENKGNIRTSIDLAEVIRRAVPKFYRNGHLHPATKTFQALRIAVNDELRRTERALPLAAKLLAPFGILGVISFHSLEDRIAKNCFKNLVSSKENSSNTGITPIQSLMAHEYSILTTKPLPSSKKERAINPSVRSAKLRAIQRISKVA